MVYKTRGGGKTAPQTILEILSGDLGWIVRWRSICNGKIAEDGIKENLHQSKQWAFSSSGAGLTSTCLDMSHSTITTLKNEKTTMRFRGSFSPATRSVMPTMNSSAAVLRACQVSSLGVAVQITALPSRWSEIIAFISVITANRVLFG